jgi:DNA-binding response OmpR family regulator
MGIQAVAQPPAHQPLLGSGRVLVVEDEALVAMLLEDELHDAGAEVLTASTVAEALRLVDTAALGGGLSAAVLDMNIGGEAVLPVADALAARGVPFVFATGYGGDHGRGRHAAAPVLGKPLDLGGLIAALHALVSARPPRPGMPGPVGGPPAASGGQTAARAGLAHPAEGEFRGAPG